MRLRDAAQDVFEKLSIKPFQVGEADISALPSDLTLLSSADVGRLLTVYASHYAMLRVRVGVADVDYMEAKSIHDIHYKYKFFQYEASRKLKASIEAMAEADEEVVRLRQDMLLKHAIVVVLTAQMESVVAMRDVCSREITRRQIEMGVIGREHYCG